MRNMPRSSQRLRPGRRAHGAHPNATVLALAERAADLILGRQTAVLLGYQAAIRSAGVKAASACLVEVPERETAMSGTGSGVTRSR
jgi:hypothetical protein